MVTEPPPIKNFDVIHGSRHYIDATPQNENTLLTSIDLYQVLCRHGSDVTKQKKPHVRFENSMVTESPPIKNFDVIHGSRHYIDVTPQDENTLLAPIDLYQVLCRHGNDVTKQKKATCAI